MGDQCGVEVDMISWLPDELLVHILSLLPLKTSASTSILSRRWLHLWKHTTKLIITNVDDVNWVNSALKSHIVDDVNWVNSALKSHIAPSLQEFTIDFRVIESNLHDVAKWLDFAFSRRVENLLLNFRAREAAVVAPRLEKIIALVPKSIGMRSLKALRLEETIMNGVDVHFFLRKCPLLKELIIRRAAITSNRVLGLFGIWRQLTRLALEEGWTPRVPEGGPRPVFSLFRHSRLKRFKLLCSRCEDHIKLVKHVVESCVALEEIEVSRSCDDGTELGCVAVDDDDSVRAATTAERTSFENTKRMKLPAHIKLRIANHSHKSH